MKYGIWKTAELNNDGERALMQAGYPALIARILASRGIVSANDAHNLLDCRCEMPSPFLMTDMEAAAGCVGLAISSRQKIAVYGDYDVDGITATCLLTHYLRSCGADVVSYIPARMEEGYGLNENAIISLHQQNVKLIITVDCGITAVEEASLCTRLGIELVITDHHECKDTLPSAAAVVDPHRPDDRYPHKNLSGVAVAFKLACALCGDPEQVLAGYADLVCLGTVADVMPLLGENRLFVTRGISIMQSSPRPGLKALMDECSLNPQELSSSAIGFTLSPRINAAGRMGRVETAVNLLLTQDPQEAARLAHELNEMNRERQTIESRIYQDATAMLPQGKFPEAIVLADEGWHQGVVGIVASRISEEYACPTFLICLDGDHGKASSRSHGGFNLFASLTELSDLLESYGGHEMAAGFTISRERIDEFREQICRLAGQYYGSRTVLSNLDIDCIVEPDMMTLEELDALSVLEPCGSGCPKPIVMMQGLTVERLTQVGGGKHLRLRLRIGKNIFNAIYFSAGAEAGSVSTGDLVDVAFTPQINSYLGERSVQMNIVDIRPSCSAECGTETRNYTAMLAGKLDAAGASHLLPSRNTLAMIWRYLAMNGNIPIHEAPICLCRKIVRKTGQPLELEQLMTCLDIFQDVGLLEQQRSRKSVTIRLIPTNGKADLTSSATMRLLISQKES